MSAKEQAKTSKKPTTKSKTLSSIAKKLLECYEKRKPVLLYGNYPADGRTELIKEVWLAGGGVDQEVEYLDDKNNSTTKEKLEEEFKKEWIKKYKTTDSRSSEGNSYYKESTIHINQHTHITDKTWRRIDCGSWNGEQTHNELTKNISNIHHHDRYNANTVRSTVIVNPMGYLFLCRGLVFLDNLYCNSGDAEDSNHYRKIAKVIHDRKWGSHKYDDTGIPLQVGGTEQTKIDWLVAYARNRDDFPDYFREQFEEIPLSPEPKEEVGKISERRLSKTTYLWLGEHPDDSFYAMVNGKEKKIEKLSENTQEYTVLLTLYNADKQRESIDVLISKCKIQKLKRGNHVPRRKKKNLHTIISKLNSKLFDIFHIEHCVKLDDTTNKHYFLVIDSRAR